MASRQDDELPTRLTVAFNELSERNAVDKLPDDLKGNAVPNQVLSLVEAVKQRKSGHAAETGARSEVNDGIDKTDRTLVRLRMAILSGYEDAGDPRIAKFGALGATDSPKENHERLAFLAEAVKAPLAAGEIALVADLQPAVLAAHAASQDVAKVAKAGSIAKRQTGSTSLEEHRQKSEAMLQRLKNHVKSHYPGQLEAFGFGIPAPAVRPRLKVGEPETPTVPPTA